MLSRSWRDRDRKYDFAVVGSGYGGAITAARLSAASPRPSVCILERGKEWEVGKFPDEPLEVAGQVRNPITNPLGLYEFLAFSDISVLQGSGLGGTSLINANVAIVPDEEVFSQVAWPQRVKLEELLPFYAKATAMLAATAHPSAAGLLKVKALDRRAKELGVKVQALNIAVNFVINGKNIHGAEQKPCIDCGDCVTGCNVGAKNTLYMNYLPAAKKNKAHIFTQVQVDWVEKVDGGWKLHGRRFPSVGFPEEFTLEASNVILSAGSLGTTEILLRSELHGLGLSPRVGTSFNGNGDFFGLAYNSDHQTNVLGFGNFPNHQWRKDGNAPGPNIVGAIRYNKELSFDKRITIEDFSFPRAYVGAAMTAFSLIGGSDTDLGDEPEEAARRLLDNPLDPYREHNAMNHTMLYLVMGHDDAKGTIQLRTNLLDPRGRIEVDWDDVGRQPIFDQMNEEIRRHARALGAHFLPNPLWNFVTLRNLITAHPLGGSPMGDDHLQGAVDEFGRVFASDGTLHKGLFVADGSLVPSALGVNPFLTISALSERIADRLVRSLGGEAYPAPPPKIAVSSFDPVEVANFKEADLERIFSRVETMGLEGMVNTGERSIDFTKGRIHNDTVWKGFFPRGHILNQMSSAIFAGFKKKFSKTPEGFVGVTSDSDERINVRNTLQEIAVTGRDGTLEPGRYILLRYLDPPWSIFYDIFKFVNDDLLIGRVYLGDYPNGARMFTFPMTRTYALDQMTVEDHRTIYAGASVPTKEQLAGLWEMRMVSNANPTGVVAYLKFDHKPDGRLEARYRLLGLLEGMSEPIFEIDNLRLNDFTPFHDEIKFVADDFMIGKYVTASPPGLSHLLGPNSLGLFHQETAADGSERFSFYYGLRRSKASDLPPPVFLQPLLDIRLPSGLGMTFEEEMDGRFYPDMTSAPGRDGDLRIEDRFINSPSEGVACSFKVRMHIRDINEFVEGSQHEARLEGTINFGDFRGNGPASFQIDPNRSYFNLFRVNEATGEAEILYHIYFRDSKNKEYLFHGRKYMQKDQSGLIASAQEILHDYTTLYCHLTRASGRKDFGSGLLKFRMFEDAEAIRDFARFLSSFDVTGTDDPALRAQARIRFLAFTNQLITREYDPLNPGGFFANG
jgi:cholesterol oxidase